MVQALFLKNEQERTLTEHVHDCELDLIKRELISSVAKIKNDLNLKNIGRIRERVRGREGERGRERERASERARESVSQGIRESGS